MFRSTRLIASTSSAVRAFSGKVSHEPPKKIFGTSGRYAGAVYTAASKANLLEKVEGELNAISETIKKNKPFSQFLENPTIPRGEKATKLGSLIEETKFTHISRNLFLTLAANGRVGEANQIISDFREIMEASRGSVKVTVVSAEALKKPQLASVESGIKAYVGANKKIEIETKVDESILGGLQVTIGDRFLDLSVLSRVNTLSQTLEAAN